MQNRIQCQDSQIFWPLNTLIFVVNCIRNTIFCNAVTPQNTKQIKKENQIVIFLNDLNKNIRASEMTEPDNLKT